MWFVRHNTALQGCRRNSGDALAWALRGKANACTGAATVAADPTSARFADAVLTLDEARSLRVIFTCVTRKNLITLKTATLRPSQPISLAPRAAIKTQLLSHLADPEKERR
ncbi:hypothetical protein IscW_ISCW009578 [Ixodes scapularis]|uniref:Uncharacterized protein n=1 Tax=Ixodes scapularis TaxID=6945 RepID=B7Q0M0_IXOSC|nr:hypothetical protein IscW_ISCW009578 [Ixodes scapularis]|eukprot:XP_002407979.1 hypothetical protein IscW_ISCW009578 [Ixodes scapularis]